MMDDLSFDAKCIAGAWFGIMIPGKGGLTFQLQESAPSDRAQDALDELVRSKIISVEPFNRYGGLVYRPLINCSWGFEFLRAHEDDPAIKWPITRKLRKGEAKGVQLRALSATPSSTPPSTDTSGEPV